MMIELHDVTIGQLIKGLSATVDDGQTVCFSGAQGAGKTTLLRALLGFIPIDGGHISIDGELLTPLSAPYFRRHIAYVPQHLSLPEGYEVIGLEQWGIMSGDERYLLLLNNAISTGKPLLIVDEPSQPVSADTMETIDRTLMEAAEKGPQVEQTADGFILHSVNAENVEELFAKEIYPKIFNV